MVNFKAIFKNLKTSPVTSLFGLGILVCVLVGALGPELGLVSAAAATKLFTAAMALGGSGLLVARDNKSSEKVGAKVERGTDPNE